MLVLTPILAAVALQASPAAPAPRAAEPGLVLSDSLEFQRWALSEGLPQLTVTDLIGTRDGYLWLTTLGGLARFDGVRFRAFTLSDTPELGTNHLHSLYEDRAGMIWIGTGDAGVARLDADGFRAFRDGAPRGVIQDFAEDAQGTLWMSGVGISRVVEVAGAVTLERFTRPDWLARTLVFDLFLASDGALWAATSRGLLRRHDGEFELIDDSPLACLTRVIQEDRLGRLLLFTEKGLVHRGDEGLELLAPWVERLYCSGSTPNGDLFFGADSGLTRIEFDASGRPTLHRLSIPADTEAFESGVTGLYCDEEGSVWAGTNAFGLVRVSSTRYQSFEDPRGLLHGSVTQVVADARGLAWVQGQTGWIGIWDGRQFRPLDEASGLSIPNSRSAHLLGVDRHGAGWVRAVESTYRITGSLEAGFETERIDEVVGRGFLEDDSGALWFGGEGQLRRYRDGRFDELELAGVDEPVHLHLRARDGALWFSGAELLGRVQPGAAPELFGPDDGLLPGRFRALYEDASRTVWATTYGNGLLRIADGTLVNFGLDQGLPDLSLGGLLEDDDGRLWINSNQGVFSVSLEELEACAEGRLPAVHCNLLNSPESNGADAVRDREGRLWFPTIRGLVLVDPAEAQADPVPPTVYVEGLLIEDTRAELFGKAIVPAGTQDFSIDYTGLTRRTPEQVRFRYRLDGYQGDWVEAGTRRRAFYTKVRPGDYTFEVIAANADGVWSPESARLPVHIEARYYQTAWFRLAAVLALIGVVWGIHRWRIAGMQARTNALRAEIEAREKAERERELMAEKLTESSRLEAVGRLAGGIAHDFNNVLTAILGRASLLQTRAEGASLDEHRDELLDHLGSIDECGRRAAALTRQLLAFGRQQMLQPRLIDPNSTVESLRPMLNQLLPESVTLRCNLRPEPGLVLVDPTQLEQVVMNLVLNARDAMPDGGTITITTSRAFVDEADVLGEPNAQVGEHLLLSVADTGTGMSSRVRSHVFEPFYTTKEPGRGTGLGLASVHGIVMQSGGHIRVETEEERGSTFRVLLPLVEDRLPAECVTPVVEPAPVHLGGTGSVLLCEDDEAIRAMLVTALGRHGYRVDSFGDPDDALSFVQSGGACDLLVTDVILPGMNGRELTAQITALRPGLPVLYMSGYTSDVLGNQPFEAGTLFLDKPFTTSTLLEKIRQLLGAVATS